MGRFDEAEKELLEAHRVLAGTPVQRWTLKALQRLVALYDAWNAAEPGKGFAEKAAEWRAKLEETSKSQNVETPKP